MYTPKEFIRRMENVKGGECYVDGEKWALPTKKNEPKGGTSANGLWCILTNGTERIRINKKDVLAISTDKAIALFNTWSPTMEEITEHKEN